ncbi:hypothetical protein BGZ83_010269 [Gryganskiella cystojenkinii]|nr:hypothetical protein BGZ83_010269 [Gryganskiella cystojenkinii]
MSSSPSFSTPLPPCSFGSSTPWRTNHSGPTGYIPHENHIYSSSETVFAPNYYDASTKTFYPTKPIRPIRPSYLKIANQEPVTLKEAQKLLVILDLNGTLFYRTKSHNRSVTPRPYLALFLDFLFEHCSVMVWSSAQPNSVEAMLGCGFGDRVPKLARIWTREHFRLPRVDYTRKVLTIKDLEFVWEGVKAENKALNATAAAKEGTKAEADGGKAKEGSEKVIKYDQTNTVLIDDSKDKSQLQPHNGLALTDFDRDLARTGTDDELLKVKNYLERLIYQQNVSAYMRVHPFDSEMEGEKIASKANKDTKKDDKEDKEAIDELDELSRQLEKSTL